MTWSSAGVTWDSVNSTPGFQRWIVAVTGPGTLSADTCTTAPVTDATNNSCDFTPSADGHYMVTVTPENDMGAAAGATGAAPVEVKSVPSGNPSGFSATQDSSTGVVTLSWSSTGVDWGNAVTKQWKVAMTGGTASTTNCDVLIADSANTCTFTPSAGGLYILILTPHNEVGDSVSPYWSPSQILSDPPATQAPTGSLTDFTATLDQSTGTVNVAWTSAGVTWGTGSAHQYIVSVSPTTVSSDTCTTSSRIDNPSLTCSFKPTATGTYIVSLTPKTQDGTGIATTRSVSYTAPTPPPPPVPAPNAPTGVTGAPGANSITVSWTAPVGGTQVNGYTVWVTAAALGADFAEYCPEKPLVTATTCTINNLPAGLAYTLHVVAAGPDNNSAEATGTPSGPPSGLPQTPAEVPAGLVPVAQVSTTSAATLTISGSGFLPGSSVVVSVHSTPVDLATVTVGADGTFTSTVTLPANLPAGSHTLLATGLATDGTVKYLSQALTVAATSGGTALPVTGGSLTRLAIVAFALLMIGGGAVVLTDGRIVRRFRRRNAMIG